MHIHVRVSFRNLGHTVDRSCLVPALFEYEGSRVLDKAELDIAGEPSIAVRAGSSLFPHSEFQLTVTWRYLGCLFPRVAHEYHDLPLAGVTTEALSSVVDSAESNQKQQDPSEENTPSPSASQDPGGYTEEACDGESQRHSKLRLEPFDDNLCSVQESKPQKR